MASSSLLIDSICPTTGFLAPALPSLRAKSVRAAGSTVPTLQLRSGAVRASSSRLIRVQAVGESSSSATEAAPSAVEDVKEGIEAGEGGCPGCGKAERVGGCNGDGRIQGGLGVIPGFRWFPIKVFRPCPAFIETGGRYRRAGQSLEEVAFGRKGTEDDLAIAERLKGGK